MATDPAKESVCKTCDGDRTLINFEVLNLSRSEAIVIFPCPECCGTETDDD